MKKAGANAGFNVTATIEDEEEDDEDDSDEDYDGCEETSLEVSTLVPHSVFFVYFCLITDVPLLQTKINLLYVVSSQGA